MRLVILDGPGLLGLEVARKFSDHCAGQIFFAVAKGNERDVFGPVRLKTLLISVGDPDCGGEGYLMTAQGDSS